MHLVEVARVGLVDSKDSVDSEEELEMPVIYSNHSLAEHSAEEQVVEEPGTHSVARVDNEHEMSEETTWKLPSLYHSWKRQPEHLEKSQSPPLSIVNLVLGVD
jgi:hypothetical protein